MTAGRSNLFLLVAMFVALSAAWGCGSDGAPQDAESASGADGAVSAAPIQSYREFAAALDVGDSSVEQVVDGLRRLAAAVGSATDGEAPALVDLRIAAEHIELNPDDPATTAAVRSSLMAAADALPGDAGFRAAVESIDPGRTIADERQAIAAALARAGDALASQ